MANDYGMHDHGMRGDDGHAKMHDLNPHNIDWNALAAKVEAYYDATGQWGILENWLKFGTPFRDSDHRGQDGHYSHDDIYGDRQHGHDGHGDHGNPHDVDWNALAAKVEAYYDKTGQWGILESWLKFGTPFHDETDHQFGDHHHGRDGHGDWHFG